MNESARELACGKWKGLLGQWLDERALAGKHTSCPMCGGKDRFRLDDKEGYGSWICSNCGAGDGFHLLERLNNWTFQDAALHVEKMAGKLRAQPVKQPRSEADVRRSLQRMWGDGKRIEPGDPVWKYLAARCDITEAPLGVRFHPALVYVHEDGTKTTHPGMLAQVVDGNGAAVSIHRTYLSDDGRKADVPTTRKLMAPTRKLENIAVRLARPADGWLGVAEGIETALCASKRFGVAVWSCLSAGMLESFVAPQGISLVIVFADNDASFTGQASAYKLARSVRMAGLECRVEVPEKQGDWADFPLRGEA